MLQSCSRVQLRCTCVWYQWLGPEIEVGKRRMEENRELSFPLQSTRLGTGGFRRSILGLAKSYSAQKSKVDIIIVVKKGPRFTGNTSFDQAFWSLGISARRRNYLMIRVCSQFRNRSNSVFQINSFITSNIWIVSNCCHNDLILLLIIGEKVGTGSCGGFSFQFSLAGKTETWVKVHC